MKELSVDVEKRYRRGPEIQACWRQPIDDFSVTVLFGPSGCGKTTILRCLAGLERVDRGRIIFAGQTWCDVSTGVFLAPQRRDVGFFFQDYALFPHLTVAGNLAFGLSGLTNLQRSTRIAELLTAFDLGGLDGRYPHQISGGQQQRAALGRVLARRPRLLLLDEPLSALDGVLREQVRGRLRQQLAAFGIPVVLVTHDRTEAMALADQMVVMVDGAVRQQGPVADVFSRPVDGDVARILGIETLLEAAVVDFRDGLAQLDVRGTMIVAAADSHPGAHVLVCIRAEDVTLVRGQGAASSARNHLSGQVTSAVPEGALVRVLLDCGFPLTALITRPSFEEMSLREGDRVTALIKAPALHLMPRLK